MKNKCNDVPIKLRCIAEFPYIHFNCNFSVILAFKCSLNLQLIFVLTFGVVKYLKIPRLFHQRKHCIYHSSIVDIIFSIFHLLNCCLKSNQLNLNCNLWGPRRVQRLNNDRRCLTKTNIHESVYIDFQAAAVVDGREITV